MTTRSGLWLAVMMAVGACKAKPGDQPAGEPAKPPAATPSASVAKVTPLALMHQQYKTKTIAKPPATDPAPPPEPPSKVLLTRVKYPAPLGDLWAYLSLDPDDRQSRAKGGGDPTGSAGGAGGLPRGIDHKKHPAVVWAHGGFEFGIDDGCFAPGPPDNDQSGAGLRTGGIIVMYPSYRGSHGASGQYEMLYGEVDDYLAAADYLRSLPYVDPERIYFAGHSTGGTLVLLAAEMTDRFRAAFAFGPADRAERYGNANASFATDSPDAGTEWRVRSPITYLADIRRPTILIEGDQQPSNAAALKLIDQAARAARAPVTTVIVPGATHFSVIAPQTAEIARRILADTDTAQPFHW
jgi:alpha/beta superfamily hydrolase